jgi:thioredoxin-like negative regulator of GroEL
MSKVSDYSEARIKNVKNYSNNTSAGLIKVEYDVTEGSYIAEGALSGAGVALTGAFLGIGLIIATGGMAGPLVAAGAMLGGPASGTVTGVLIDKSKHHVLYFDSVTEEFVGNDIDEARRKQYDIRIGEGQSLLNQGKFTEARDKFAQAWRDSNNSSIYNKYANCRDSISIAVDAQTLLNIGKFSEAVVKFAQAHNGASVTSIKDKLKNCEDSAKLAADSQTLLNSGKFSEAVVKFAQAHNGASVTSVKDKLKNCLDSTKLAAEGQTLLNSGEPSEAAAKFQAAYSLSNISEISSKFSSCLAAANIEVEAQTLLEDDVEEVDVEEQESDEEVEGNLAEPVIDVLGDHSVGEVEFTTE